jgi:hypothetical protein
MILLHANWANNGDIYGTTQAPNERLTQLQYAILTIFNMNEPPEGVGTPDDITAITALRDQAYAAKDIGVAWGVSTPLSTLSSREILVHVPGAPALGMQGLNFGAFSCPATPSASG